MIVLQLAGVKPLTANDVRRMTWPDHRNAKAALEQQVLLSSRRLHPSGWPRLSGLQVATLEVQPPDRTHHDADGWAPTLKACLDVCVDRKVLLDDCTCHIAEVRIRPLPVGPGWGFRLRLDPVGADDVIRAEPSTELCNSTTAVRSS